MADPVMWTPVLVQCVFILIVNGFVLFILLRSGLFRSRQNAFVINLLGCDCLRAFVVLARILVVMAGPAASGSDVICVASGFFEMTTGVTDCVAFTLLLYDRHRFVSSPINYLHQVSRGSVMFSIAYGAAHAMFVAALPLIGWGHFIYVTPHETCDVDWVVLDGYAQFAAAWGILLPLAGSGFCFARIWRMVRMRTTQIRVYNMERAIMEPVGLHRCIGDGAITEVDTAFLKTFRLLAILVACCFLSWLSRLALMVRLMVPGEAPSQAAVVAVAFISLLSCTVNPFMYGVYNRKFKQTLHGVVSCGRHTESDVLEISAYSIKSPSLLALSDYRADLAQSVRCPQPLDPTGPADGSLAPDNIRIGVKNVWT
ncbi:hypothetical protein LSAT2_020684 [Lamellibrachia satsuma]|nr:hypothetical protein LSAT2_020684 [Lamellibrachia satsuma]